LPQGESPLFIINTRYTITEYLTSRLKFTMILTSFLSKEGERYGCALKKQGCRLCYAPEKVTLCGGETILLVDDEKSITDVVGEMIKGLGYRLLSAGSGEEALNVYQANPGRIDLVIMDMIMPGWGGGAAIDATRTINPAARIILSSGYRLNGKAQDILNRGGIISFMQKTF
jgi:CheY-like chemotaxis protein